MKHRLLIMRHAKSSWEDTSLDDKMRPLNKRGHKAAPNMGGRIASLGYKWDLLISSPALRAKNTAEYVAAAIGYDKEILIDNRLYFEGARAIGSLIREFDDSIKSVMLFGHDPDMHDFYERLSGKELFKFPTAACALFESKKSWASFEGYKELWFDTPKNQQ